MMSNCGCCGNSGALQPHLPPTNNKCRASVLSTTIGELLWVQGLDENLCEKFQRLSDILGLRDCAGNRINVETPVVTCADFRAQLCAALSGLAAGGEATTQTLLVGADCKLYSIPGGGEQVETPNAAIDSPSVDITLSGTLSRTIRADVVISDDAGNQLEQRPDGLFVPEPGDAVPTACQQIQAFPVGTDVQSGTLLIGADCQKHMFVAPDALTVLDTSTVNLTLIGGDVLQADLILSPDSIGAITPDGLEITCADVLECAPPVTVNDTQSVDLLLTGQLLQANVNISNQAGNNLELLPDGLYISVCEALEYGGPATPAVPGVTRLVGEDCLKYTIPEQTAPGVIDTTTVNLSVVGSAIQADVNIQPNTLLTVGPQGLQVTCESVQDCIGNTPNNFFSYDDVGGSFTFAPSSDAGNQIGVGTDGNPFVPPSALTVLDTQCINLSLVGDVLSAVPVISAQPNNGLTCQGDGLYAESVNIDIVGGSTECIQVIVNETPGPNQFEIVAQPILDPNPLNALSCGPLGLFVPTAGVNVQGASQACITVQVDEAPAGNFEVSAFPVISSMLGNIIDCAGDGLYVPQTNLTVTDSSCINLTVDEDPSNTFDLTASLVIDPNPCNAASCAPNGLLVVEHTGGTDSETGAPVQSPAAESEGTVVGADICIAVANPSNCRSAVLLVTYRFPEVETTGNDETPHITRFFTERSVNIPGVEVTAGFVPLTQVRLSGNTSLNVFGIPSSDITHTYVLPPSAAGLVCTRASFEVELGTAIVFVGSPAVTFTVFTI